MPSLSIPIRNPPGVLQVDERTNQDRRPETLCPGPPLLHNLHFMPNYLTYLELVTLGALKTGLDPVKAFDPLRWVDALGFVIDHIGQRGLAGGFIVLVTTVSRV
jgi:hypothetical protein